MRRVRMRERMRMAINFPIQIEINDCKYIVLIEEILNRRASAACFSIPCVRLIVVKVEDYDKYCMKYSRNNDQ
jgi:hypothetical protein